MAKTEKWIECVGDGKSPARRIVVKYIGGYKTGKGSDLLMHGNSMDGKLRQSKWQKDPRNKNVGEKGSDMWPAWTWTNYLYHDNVRVCMMSDNIHANLTEAASRISAGGKATFSSIFAGGFICDQAYSAVVVAGHEVLMKDVKKMLMNDREFEAHMKFAEEQGFELFVKPVAVGKKKHTRVRPRFPDWEVQFTASIFDDRITNKVLEQVFFEAGSIGLGDWRTSNKNMRPGQYGHFTAMFRAVD